MLWTPRVRDDAEGSDRSSVLAASAAAAAVAIVGGGALSGWFPSHSGAMVFVIGLGWVLVPTAPVVPLGLLAVLFGSEVLFVSCS